MSFKTIQIRYQTARSLPAPYAYFYVLTAQAIASQSLQIDLAITYPDRDDIDDDELIAEGYTRDDDFKWSGRLPKTWLSTFDSFIGKTQLQEFDEEKLGEDDDYWEVELDVSAGSIKKGRPNNADDWQYLMQELIQASYELVGRERPFELTYLDFSGKQNNMELRLTASFAERTVQIVTFVNKREQRKTVPWTVLQHTMAEVYNHEFEEEEAQLKRPRQEGQWLNIGSEEWYDVSEMPSLQKRLRNL